ncbi:putative NUDIX hydrolase-like [Yasminevirus sp. GU-2018]|uniref:Putative NUDIX hydrolase-like n=1 Tax=Yasminevirus sp. GU-2018 TaxID=2420051 RepID=A0A5K0U7U3_9VIRU|nr:putative NUDIX hydrolase-like [Yasminevirus sp. GU-2018]
MPGASAFPVMIYNIRDPRTKQVLGQKRVLILGLERGGSYAGTYNVPGGGYEHCDGMFQGRYNLFNTMVRELQEEFALPAVHQCVGAQRKPDIRVNSTPVWLLNVQTGVSRSHFRQTPEMLAIEFIDLDYLISVVRSGQRGRLSVYTVDAKVVTVSEYTVRIVFDMLASGVLN